MRHGRAGLKDVAQRAGVSIATVSRAFSDPARVAPDTVERVLAVARELRYTPSPIGRALQAGVAPYVGVVVPDIANPHTSTLVKAVQARARERGVGVLIADTDDVVATERQVCETFARQTRGVVLYAPRMGVERIRELDALVPLVLVNRAVSGIAGFSTDSVAAYGELVEELARLGHRAIAYLPGPSRSWADGIRRRAVADRCAATGVALVVLPSTSALFADGVAAAGQAVDANVTAVVAFDDVLAAGVVEGLRRRGLSVPRDLSVAGHDDALTGLVQPPLTTIVSHIRELGERALEHLLDAPTAGSPSGLAGELTIRASTGPAPGRVART